MIPWGFDLVLFNNSSSRTKFDNSWNSRDHLWQLHQTSSMDHFCHVFKLQGLILTLFDFLASPILAFDYFHVSCSYLIFLPGFCHFLIFCYLHVQKHKNTHIWHLFISFWSFWVGFWSIKDVCICTHHTQILKRSYLPLDLKSRGEFATPLI